MPRCLLSIAVCCAAGVLAGPLAAQVPTAIPDFVAAAEEADVVLLGEVHDNPEHHRTQAAIVRALQPAALVFEMIPQNREDEVNALREQGADRDAIAAALDWEASGWPSFDYYAEVLEAAPTARIFGAGQPVAEVRRAVAEGAAAAFGPEAATYGLDQPLPPGEQAARVALLAAVHCAPPPPDRLAGMVEAQRFRDAELADAALWARTMTSDGQVVVIAGSGHVDRTHGVPALLAIADPELRVVSLGQFEAGPDDPADYDAVVLAPAPERRDPCAPG